MAAFLLATLTSITFNSESTDKFVYRMQSFEASYMQGIDGSSEVLNPKNYIVQSEELDGTKVLTCKLQREGCTSRARVRSVIPNNAFWWLNSKYFFALNLWYSQSAYDLWNALYIQWDLKSDPSKSGNICLLLTIENWTRLVFGSLLYWGVPTLWTEFS